jgi:hypothetical protein
MTLMCAGRWCEVAVSSHTKGAIGVMGGRLGFGAIVTNTTNDPAETS